MYTILDKTGTIIELSLSSIHGSSWNSMACPARVRRATFQRGIFHGVSFARKIDWPIRLQRVVSLLE